MPAVISFCLSISMLTLLAARETANARFKLAAKNYTSAQVENENMKMVLNYIIKQRSYLPTVSLVSLNARSNFADFVSKYISNESMTGYKISMNNLSRKYAWQNRIDLMWILIVDDVDILHSFVRKQRHIWKATNQYLIIVTSRSGGATEKPLEEEIFRSVWETYSVNKILAVSIQENFRCLNGYLPFEENRRNQYGAVRKLCLTGQEDPAWLYDKLENLNGYPLRLVVFQSQMMNITLDEKTGNTKFSGLDADAMSLLQEAMGSKFIIKVTTRFGKEDPFHRTLQYIENGETDLIITSFFVHNYEEFHKYEFTTSIFEDKLCLIAPTAGFVPKSYMPVLPFTSDLWVALAVYNLLISILWYFVKYHSEAFRRRKIIILPLTKPILSRRSNLSDLPPRINPYVSSCFSLVETFCYPLKEEGGNNTAAQRAILLGTLFFGLIVTGLYQSCLVSSLSDPFHYPELNTLKDVANSNFTIITKYRNLKDNTFTGNNSLDKKLRNKIQVFTSNNPTNDAVAFNKKIAIGRYSSFKLDNLSKYYDEDGNELLHVVEEYPTTYLLSYVMRLHSPYRERIDGLLLRMKEAGLFILWYENMTYPMYVDQQRRKVDKSERKIKLTLEHYSLTFLGLSLGLLACTVVFFAELYFAKGHRRNRSNGSFGDMEMK